MTSGRILPFGTAVMAIGFAAGMSFVLPASAADKTTEAGMTAAACLEQVQKTERAVDSLGPESPGEKTTMKTQIQQARGACGEGQFKDAQQTLADIQSVLSAKGVSTDVTEKKSASTGGTTAATTARGGAMGPSKAVSPKERAESCMQRAQQTENAIESLSPESPGHKTQMQSRVQRAQGFCMEGQVAEANDILTDLGQSLKGEGVPNTQARDTTGTKTK